jgi:tetratricopeptide (TPR) repeat protein
MTDSGELLAKAEALAGKKRFTEAAAILERALQVDPKDARVRLKLADLLVRAGDAVTACTQIIEAARVYRSEGFHLKALATLRQAVALDASRLAVRVDIAEVCAALGLIEDALREIDEIARALDVGAPVPTGYRDTPPSAAIDAARTRLIAGDAAGAMEVLRRLSFPDARHA